MVNPHQHPQGQPPRRAHLGHLGSSPPNTGTSFHGRCRCSRSEHPDPTRQRDVCLLRGDGPSGEMRVKTDVRRCITKTPLVMHHLRQELTWDLSAHGWTLATAAAASRSGGGYRLLQLTRGDELLQTS